jgi:hypothetical protein
MESVEPPAAPEVPVVAAMSGAEELSALVSGPGTSESEQDAALKWLESLAEKQGAKAEELITNPADRQETAPDWVSQGDQEPAAVAESAPLEAAGPDESLAWLDALSADEQSAASSETDAGMTSDQTSAEMDEQLDWLGDLSQPSGQPETSLRWEQVEPQHAEAQPVASDDTVSSDLLSASSQDTDEIGSIEQPVSADASKPPSAAEYADFNFSEPQTKTEAIPATTDDSDIPQSSADISAWLNGLDNDEMPADQGAASQDEDVADWLKDSAQPAAEQPIASEVEELPDWLKDMSTDDQPPVPQQVSGWIPSVTEQDDEDASEYEQDQPSAEQPGVPAAAADAPVVQRSVMLQPGALGSDKDAVAVQTARDLLAHGGLDGAMTEYTKLIKKGRLLEEVIYDLQEAVYSHPVDVIVWQTLGDAYFRTNRLQEALDAYSKAEGLLR